MLWQSWYILLSFCSLEAIKVNRGQESFDRSWFWGFFRWGGGSDWCVIDTGFAFMESVQDKTTKTGNKNGKSET